MQVDDGDLVIIRLGESQMGIWSKDGGGIRFPGRDVVVEQNDLERMVLQSISCFKEIRVFNS